MMLALWITLTLILSSREICLKKEREKEKSGGCEVSRRGDKSGADLNAKLLGAQNEVCMRASGCQGTRARVR